MRTASNGPRCDDRSAISRACSEMAIPNRLRRHSIRYAAPAGARQCGNAGSNAARRAHTRGHDTRRHARGRTGDGFPAVATTRWRRAARAGECVGRFERAPPVPVSSRLRSGRSGRFLLRRTGSGSPCRRVTRSTHPESSFAGELTRVLTGGPPSHPAAFPRPECGVLPCCARASRPDGALSQRPAQAAGSLPMEDASATLSFRPAAGRRPP